MKWITQSNALNSISNTLETFTVLEDLYQHIDKRPVEFIKWLMVTDTASNFQALTGITLSAADAKLVEQFVDKLQAGLDKEYQPLFHPLSALDANSIESNVEFELLDQSGESDPQQLGDLTLNLSGNAKGSITLEGNDNDKATTLVGKRAVSINLKGQLQAKVGGELPINVGSISGYSSLSGGAGVTTMSQIDDSELFISALIQTVNNSANPFDLADIAQKIKSPDCFAKQAIALQGELAYGGSLALGYKTQNSVGAVINGSASIGYDASIKGSFDLIIEKADQNTVDITIKRGKSDSSAKTFAVGVTVDATAIATEVSDKLNGKLEGGSQVLQQAIDQINQVYAPGEYIEQKISQWLDNSNLSDTLLESAKLALGQGNIDDTKKVLTDKITNTLKNEFFTWTDDIDGKAQQLITTFAEQANIPASVLTPARAEITGIVTDLTNSLNSKIADFATDNATRVTDLLNDVRVNVSKLTDSTDAVIQAQAGLVKLITNLQNRINETATKIANKDNYQLQAKLTSSTSKTTGSDLLLKYRFDLSNEANLSTQQAMLEQLIKGRTKALFTNAQTNQSIAGVTLKEGVLTTSADLTESDVGHLSLFGADINYQALLDVKTKVVQNANGDIDIVSQAQYDDTFSALGSKQGAQFIDVFNIATAKYSTLNINFALSVEDEKFSFNDLSYITSELENKSLISEALVDEITEDFWEVSQGNNVNSAITFKLALDNQQAAYFLGEQNETDTYIERFTQAFNHQLTDSSALRSLETKMRNKIRAHFKPEMSFAEFVARIDLTSLDNFEAKLKLNNSKQRTVYNNVKRFKQKADAYASIIAIMSEIYHAEPDDLTAILLRQKQQEIGKNLRYWVDSFADLLQLLRPNLANNSLKFAQLLIMNSGANDDERASLSAQAIYS